MTVTASSILQRLTRPSIRHKNIAKPKDRLPPNPHSSILRSIEAGDLRGAISLLRASPSLFSASIYSRLLHLCASRRAIVAARCVESHIISSSHPSRPSTFLLNRAIETYAICGYISDARELFDEMPHRTGGTWNAIISAYASAGHPSEALSLFARMNRSGIRPKDVTFASALRSCAALLAITLAKQLQALIFKFGFYLNVILATSLVDVYGKCQIMDQAEKIFNEIPSPNSISWNVIIRRYLDLGMTLNCITMFFKMILTKTTPLNFTISTALIACSDASMLTSGCQIHGISLKLGFQSDYIVESSTMEMYAKCGHLKDARRIFNASDLKDVVSWTAMVSGYASSGQFPESETLFYAMPCRNVVSWNALLAGYVQSFSWEKAFKFFREMQQKMREIDFITLGLILSACANLLDSEKGRQIHGFSYRHLLLSELYLNNALLDMYTKCGNLKAANTWFLQMGRRRDEVSWNSLLAGYARHGRSEAAFDVFKSMLNEPETDPNEFTFSLMLAASANIFLLEQGKQIHAYMIRKGFNMDVVIRGALVDMYCKCRWLEYAVRVFEAEISRDLVLWNSMILGYAHNGRGDWSIKLFEEMVKVWGIGPDHVTFIGVLLGCIDKGWVGLGCEYFNKMGDEYCITPRVEHYECMIELLGKHGCAVEVEELIRRMPFEPTLAMWSRLYESCSEHVYRRLREVNAN